MFFQHELLWSNFSGTYMQALGTLRADLPDQPASTTPALPNGTRWFSSRSGPPKMQASAGPDSMCHWSLKMTAREITADDIATQELVQQALMGRSFYTPIHLIDPMLPRLDQQQSEGVTDADSVTDNRDMQRRSLHDATQSAYASMQESTGCVRTGLENSTTMSGPKSSKCPKTRSTKFRNEVQAVALDGRLYSVNCNIYVELRSSMIIQKVLERKARSYSLMIVVCCINKVIGQHVGSMGLCIQNNQP